MKVAVLLFLSATQVFGADFRTINLGESCESVAAKEAALDSIEIEWPSIDGAVMYAFEGKALESQVTIGYLCSQGGLLAGNYYFRKANLASAIANYGAVHKQLVSAYGAPYLDDSRWMQPLDMRWLQTDPAKYSTTWKTPRMWVTMNILPLQDSGDEPWQLIVSYISPSERVSSNTSLERTLER